MSLQIIIQEIKIFGKLLPYKISEGEQIQEFRKFRMTLGDNTYVSKDYGFFISENELAFDQIFSFYYDNHSLIIQAQIYKQHQFLNNSDLNQILFAQIDLSDITNIVADRIQTNLTNMKNQAVGKLTMMIEVFKQGPRFIEKVTSKVLFETVKEEKIRQHQVSSASKNIKNLMVNNSLTNTLMTINYLQVKPDKQDPQTFNRESFIMIRYGFNIKAFSKIFKIVSKDNIIWNDYLEFMKNQDVKFQFFFIFFDDLGSIVCKAKGQIKYIVFDETINNHCITLFDKRSNIYGQIFVKFIQKQVQVVNIKNPLQKKLRQKQKQILDSIQAFNRFKFESQNNNRILSQKLRQLQLRRLQQQQQKMKPLDQQQKKKREQHSKFIDFLQKQVIKIDKQLKKKQINEKKEERKQLYQKFSGKQKTVRDKDSKFNLSLSSSQFRSELRQLGRLEEIQMEDIIAEQVNNQVNE